MGSPPAAAGASGAQFSGPGQSTRSLPLPRSGHARLDTFVRNDGIDLVLHAQGSITRHRVAVPLVELHRSIHTLRSALSRPGGDALPAARRLHAWLIAPLQRGLRGVQRLHIDADGALRLVPFAALHDGHRYLAERLELVLAIGASPPPAPVPRLAATTAAPPGLLAFGRTLPDASHAALPGVHAELAALSRLQARPVTALQDAAFTRDALHAGLARRPAVVHLASHFVLDAAGEDSSYLLLGDGTRLPLSQVGSLPWQGVRLAVLSACDSGLPLPHEAEGRPMPTAPGGATGSAAVLADVPAAPMQLSAGRGSGGVARAPSDPMHTATGRQLAGFASALQRAGVDDVLATLWPISDGATAQWMASFYAPWNVRGRSGLPHPGWLARAQRDWLQRHHGTPLAHPHYWAAFTWMGR